MALSIPTKQQILMTIMLVVAIAVGMISCIITGPLELPSNNISGSSRQKESKVSQERRIVHRLVNLTPQEGKRLLEQLALQQGAEANPPRPRLWGNRYAVRPDQLESLLLTITTMIFTSSLHII